MYIFFQSTIITLLPSDTTVSLQEYHGIVYFVSKNMVWIW